MFARAVELTIKAEKKPEFIKKTKSEVLPILNTQVGFFEILALDNEIELTKCMVITLWRTKRDAERYEKDTLPKVKQLLEPFLAVPPVVKIYNVDEAISQKMMHIVAA